MRVSSAPGQGTTFALYLPLREAERRSASPAPAGHGEPVLVVVEETGLMLMLRDTIESHGYRVLTAQGGFAAVQSLHEQGLPAAVVMEAKMNLMTGVHTATALIERDFRGPVVMHRSRGQCRSRGPAAPATDPRDHQAGQSCGVARGAGRGTRQGPAIGR